MGVCRQRPGAKNMIDINSMKQEANKKRAAIIRRSKGLAAAIEDFKVLAAKINQAEGPQSAYRYKKRNKLIYPLGKALESMIKRNDNM